MKQTTEQYVYDYITTLVAIGGSLGLFLGYSCKDMIIRTVLYLIKWRTPKRYLNQNQSQVELENSPKPVGIAMLEK